MDIRKARAFQKAELQRQIEELSAQYAEKGLIINAPDAGKGTVGRPEHLLTPIEQLQRSRRRRGEIERKDIEEAKESEIEQKMAKMMMFNSNSLNLGSNHYNDSRS